VIGALATAGLTGRGLSAEPAPVPAYDGSSKDLKDLEDARAPDARSASPRLMRWGDATPRWPSRVESVLGLDSGGRHSRLLVFGLVVVGWFVAEAA
jgi:hypothetical protein